MTSVLSWWLMAMIMYPDVQKRMHDELDRVVGRDRLPTFEDCENMPYLQAMVREIIRWRPIDPLGLPHTTSEDIWYNGYFIPKGTMLVPNVWAINRNPATFGADAHHFNPARHLDKNGKLGPAPADTKEEGHVSFGFGRRVCPGRFFANKMLLINLVLLAWATNIDGERGPDGEFIGLDVDGYIDEGIVVYVLLSRLLSISELIDYAQSPGPLCLQSCTAISEVAVDAAGDLGGAEPAGLLGERQLTTDERSLR